MCAQSSRKTGAFSAPNQSAGKLVVMAIHSAASSGSRSSGGGNARPGMIAATTKPSSADFLPRDPTLSLCVNHSIRRPDEPAAEKIRSRDAGTLQAFGSLLPVGTLGRAGSLQARDTILRPWLACKITTISRAFCATFARAFLACRSHALGVAASFGSSGRSQLPPLGALAPPAVASVPDR